MTDTESAGPLMATLREALGDTEARLTFTFGIAITGTRHGVLVEHRTGYHGKWTKYPQVIYPSEDMSVADLMHALATIREEERHARDATG